ncbi:phosphoenolpyruvate synthase [Candidatus Shapirobacteria bacterium CG08_land_8_20_14_0_20_39_18]|uniref:Phosphoenolpyruvate synthase n=1 Tax=Candidatus Shapirobacteria bacterium CG08_land_8_20_14_0_20_39_18 TaxID=1974883 RepID=A0A2M6XD73_9BACT|nr:MAG: phosphoenolpyruvate synthase [Candidatus Shapirobacteria bacterium CG08_land_8_20_14_0_20_39_18]
MNTAQKYIAWFKEIHKEDIPLVGGKGANLGEMYNFGIPVPPGFVISSQAYFYFLEQNNLQPKIKSILTEVNRDDPSSYTAVSDKIKKVFQKAIFPRDLALEIMKSYLKLGNNINHTLVAVRSSATAEDLPTASFAGQQRSFLNIKGEANIVRAVQECYASLFEPRAIFYRQQNHFDHFKVGLAVPVQKMIQSDVSGVMFTVNPVTNAKNEMVIEAVWGLGEMIVQGQVTPDRYLINKSEMKIIGTETNTQTVQLTQINHITKEVKVPQSKQDRRKIDDKMILKIAKFGKELQAHYFFPQDCEWAIEKGKLYFVQTRPITTLENKEAGGGKRELEEENKKKTVLLTGISACPGIATGPVKIIHSPKEIGKVTKGDILVTEMTTPDFVPALRDVVAIITDRGGQTSHAAIVSRELGVPCIVGTQTATKVLKTGQFVTVNGKTGEIYKPFSKNDQSEKAEILTPLVSGDSHSQNLLRTATKIYVNLAEPDLASEIAQKNVDGIGLARAEFLVAQLGIHPKKLIEERKQNLFIDHMFRGLSKFCEQFYPRPVVYRATDFKTNEYRNLTGGKTFEPEEPNPLLGYRGAFRYLSDPDVFELELDAIKKVREKYDNLNLMIPFIHIPWELAQVKKIMASKGLLRSPTFKLWIMVEIPSNVIMLEDFIKIGIDGVSIGSNDLTMLILGIDRDNSEVAPIFSEKDPAVLWALEKVIKTCHKYQVTCSICGQAPSMYPDLVDKLVEWGITSISVNPDVIDQVRQTVYEAENRLIKKTS